MKPAAIRPSQLTQQLLELGVAPGGVLLVHCAFSKVGPVEDGPSGLIAALETALGPQGTLVMPSMTDVDDQPFDPRITPCLSMGVVANTFWKQPGVLRSHNPHAFAASGPEAARITAKHPIDPPHGRNSPVGRVHELDGRVLLLGVGQDANTTIHLAENLAGVRYRRKQHVLLLESGRAKRFDYEEIDHCCQNFQLVDSWLDEENLQRYRTLGQAEARLARSQDIVRVVLEQLRRNQTVFLHPPGVDVECDEARASLLTRSSR